jgi:integrase
MAKIVRGETRGRPNRWIVDYVDHLGKRRWITCRTKERADLALARVLMTPGTRSRVSVDPDITLTDYMESWLKQVTVTRTVRTSEIYRDLATRHILPTLGRVKVRTLSTPVIRELLLSKLTTLKRNSVRGIHGVLTGCLHRAVRDGLLTINPTVGLSKELNLRRRDHGSAILSKAMSREQVSLFLETAGRVSNRYYSLLLFLARTGCRVSEGLALEWRDVDLTKRQATIQRAISGGRESLPKTAESIRTVDLSQDITARLAQLWKWQQQEARRLNRPLPMTSKCFISRGGGPLNEWRCRHAMTRALQRAKLPTSFSPHSLRHSFASILLSEGVSLQFVQRQLGHRSVTMTADLYGRWLPMSNLAAVDSLDDPH